MKKNYKKILCFDVDGVICKTKKSNYKNSIPIKKNINIINKLYDKNFYIKIFTARYMGRFKENKTKVNKKLNETKIFLNEKCKLKYHQLIMGKPEYDLFIDDKNHNFNKNWSKNLEKKFNI